MPELIKYVFSVNYSKCIGKSYGRRGKRLNSGLFNPDFFFRAADDFADFRRRLDPGILQGRNKSWGLGGLDAHQKPARGLGVKEDIL
jgi:hypothetical protein